MKFKNDIKAKIAKKNQAYIEGKQTLENTERELSAASYYLSADPDNDTIVEKLSIAMENYKSAKKNLENTEYELSMLLKHIYNYQED